VTQPVLDFTAHQDQLARDAGMARATAHANTDHTAWSERAYAALVNYCCFTPRFAGHELIAAAELAGVPRVDGRAWGSVFVRAAKAGLIQKAGFTINPHRHQSPTPVWISLICGQAQEGSAHAA